MSKTQLLQQTPQGALSVHADANAVGYSDPVAPILIVLVTANPVRPKGVDKISVGVEMMPRRAVSLIFVDIAKGLGVVSGAVCYAVVIMVTTMLAPALLKITLAQRSPHAVASIERMRRLGTWIFQ